MATYRFKTKPYRHQYAALKKLLELEWGGALLMEPRTGKTKVAIDFMSIRHQQGRVSRVLVVCPVAIIDVWVQEITTHCPFPHTITIWDREGRRGRGKNRKGASELPKFGRDTLDFVIINYDAFATVASAKKEEVLVTDSRGRTKLAMRAKRREDGSIERNKRKGGRYEIVKQLKAWAPQGIILDESHRIKSPSAAKATTLVRLGPIADYRIICTGTAVTKAKRVFDLYMQWRFLKPDSRLLWDRDAGRTHTSATFKDTFGRWIRLPDEKFDRFVANKNQARLHRLVHAESFAVTRAECFDLPKAFPDQLIYVPLEETAKVYDEMAEDMIAKIETGEVTEASIRLVQNLRFAQITSGLAKTEPSVAYPEGREIRIGSEKLRMLADLLEDWFDQDEKIVICARFRTDINDIDALVKKMKVPSWKLYGGQTREERTKNIAQFRLREGAGAFIMNPQAGSMGIDLRTASTMVWYSMVNSYVDHTQARDRIALSEVACRFVYLLAEGTYDELQYSGFLEDKDVVSEIHKSPDILRRNFKP